MAETTSTFYKEAAEYWAKVPATVDGILGGFGSVSDLDIEGSNAFLNYLFSLKHAPATKLALDCGAGIGRVTKNLLVKYFDKVELVEQDGKFVAKARQLLSDNPKIGKIYQKSLQNFVPTRLYDVIWCQWVIGHLKDYDLVDFLKRCSDALSETGVIVIKDNITTSKELEFDEEDSSVTRPYELMMLIFDRAELTVIKECHQTNFPDDLYDVYMFALVPKSTSLHRGFRTQPIPAEPRM